MIETKPEEQQRTSEAREEQRASRTPRPVPARLQEMRGQILRMAADAVGPASRALYTALTATAQAMYEAELAAEAAEPTPPE